MPLETRTIAIALGIDAAVAIVCLLAFSLLRCWRFTARFYAPNRQAAGACELVWQREIAIASRGLKADAQLHEPAWGMGCTANYAP